MKKNQTPNPVPPSPLIRSGTIRFFHNTCKSRDPTADAHFTLVGFSGGLLRVSIFRGDNLSTPHIIEGLIVINLF